MSERPLIFIPDATYDHPDYYPGLEEADASEKFRKETKDKFQISSREANIGAGADWPAVALEAIEFIKDREAVLAGIALFFSGKKINENLDAWLSIGKKLSSSLKGFHFVLNRSASVFLAIFRNSEASGGHLQSIELKEYKPLDGRGISSLSEMDVAKISILNDGLEEERLGSVIHYFRLSLNDVEAEILAKGSAILISRLGDENEK
jgi:hypothetical protein